MCYTIAIIMPHVHTVNTNMYNYCNIPWYHGYESGEEQMK